MRRVGGIRKVTPGSQLLLSVSGKRVPTARMTSASDASRLAAGEPQKPIIPRSCGWSGGRTPVPISVWTTGSRSTPRVAGPRRPPDASRRRPGGRPGGAAELGGDAAAVAGVSVGRATGEAGHDVRLEGLGEDVHRDGDEDRAGPTRQCRVPGPREDARHLVARDGPATPA